MKKLAVSTIALLSLISAHGALAADMAAPVYKAPPPPPPAYSWTGFYLYGGGGYGTWRADTTIISGPLGLFGPLGTCLV